MKLFGDKTYTMDYFDWYENQSKISINNSNNSNNKPVIYDDHKSRILFIADLMKKIKWDSCLDIGCGTCDIYKEYLKNNEEKTVYGLELTKTFCNKINNDKINFIIQGDWNFLPIKSKSVDLVLWSEGPEHSIDPEYCFNDIKRITKKYIIFSVPDWNYLIPGHLQIFSNISFGKKVFRYFDILQYTKVSPSWLIVLGKQKE